MNATNARDLTPVPRAGVHIVADPARYADTAAAFLGGRLATLAETGPISIALSGGSTPGPVYEALGRKACIDWDLVDVFFADERAVPFDDPRSNYRLARETLIGPAGIDDARVHRLPVDAHDLGAAAATYGRHFPDRIDLLILGMGADGHTASLFPGMPALDASEPIVATRAPVEPFERLTITPGVIAAARIVVVLAHGADKAGALGNALSETGDVGQCPARLARSGIWILGSDIVGALRGQLGETGLR